MNTFVRSVSLVRSCHKSENGMLVVKVMVSNNVRLAALDVVDLTVMMSETNKQEVLRLEVCTLQFGLKHTTICTVGYQEFVNG